MVGRSLSGAIPQPTYHFPFPFRLGGVYRHFHRGERLKLSTTQRLKSWACARVDQTKESVINIFKSFNDLMDILIERRERNLRKAIPPRA